ncbi:hypothetical protein [Mycoplasmopsis columbina]|uniref:hypothetical protein n=1 Tax=Mycoplasmopsis columbina TaxID=114881 RepID=UPI0004A6F6E4|nr:hypothetical protein [Mycoplasmopsis columbina]VEU76736.1 Uncharacterised protein [Mycoplasmopsis columbina]
MKKNKKLFFNAFTFSTLLISSPFLAISCVNEKNNPVINQEKHELIANDKGRGYFPSTIEKMLHNAQTKEDILSIINSFSSQKLNLNTKKLNVNFDKSIFKDFTDHRGNRETKIILNLDNGKETEVLLNNLGINNEYDPSVHEFEKQLKQYFWDGELIIEGIATSAAATKDDDSLAQKISNEVRAQKTYQEQLEVIKKYFDVSYVINDEYDYIINQGTHSHPNELHWVFGRIKKDETDRNNIQWISNVIKGIGKESKYEDAHAGDWNNPTSTYAIGSLNFTQNLTNLGKSTTSDDFLSILKNKFPDPKWDDEELLNLFKQYINIDGEYDKNKYSVFFDLPSTHTHGPGNLHLYYQLKDFDKNTIIYKAVAINNFGQLFTVGKYQFAKFAGVWEKTEKNFLKDKALYTSRYTFLKQLSNITNVDEMFEHIKNYINLNEVENSNEKVLSFNFNQSLANLKFKSEFFKYYIDKNNSSYNNVKGEITIQFVQENLLTGEKETTDHIIKGFKGQNNKSSLYKSLFNGEITLTPIFDIVNHGAEYGTAASFLNLLKLKSNFNDQLNTLKEYFGDLNTNLDEENYEYAFDLDKSEIIHDTDATDILNIKVLKTNKETKNKEEAILPIYNLSVNDVDLTKSNLFNGEINIVNYIIPSYDLENTDQYEVPEAKVFFDETVKESLEETSDLFYGKDVTLTSKSLYRQADFDDVDELVLVFNVQNIQTQEISTKKVIVKNFGQYRKLGDYVFNLKPPALNDDNKVAAWEIKEALSNLEGHAKWDKLLELLIQDKVVGVEFDGETKFNEVKHTFNYAILEEEYIGEAPTSGRAQNYGYLRLKLAAYEGDNSDNPRETLNLFIKLDRA